jgi:hypothetical protein
LNALDTPLRTATSPDGALTLELYGGGDDSVSLKGHDWHTHGDMLMPGYGRTPGEAAQAFFEAVIRDVLPICIDTETHQAWIAESQEDAAASDDTRAVIIRLWSGEVLACPSAT